MNWIEIIGPTLLVIIGGIISWNIQTKIERLNQIKEVLRKERINKYNDIIDPIVIMYSKVGGSVKKANEVVQSYKYRKAAFELNFWGSDEVINAYNNLMQFIYNRVENNGKDNDPKELLKLLGQLLLEIRKDVGNENTKLNSIDMLRSMISDIDYI